MSERRLETGWRLRAVETCEEKQSWQEMRDLFEGEGAVYSLPAFPMQVHDVLLAEGIIENPNIRGINRDLWIHERDWIYRCDFEAGGGLQTLLCMDGADTFAEVWLNGRRIGQTDDVYLKWQWDVTEHILEENTLIVYFHSAQRIVDRAELKAEYRGLIPPYSALRVFRTGFHDYCGPSPCLIRCGLYAPVRLLQADPIAMKDGTVRADYDPERREGLVELIPQWLGETAGEHGQLKLIDEEGRIAAEKEFPLSELRAALRLNEPELWNPWTHGKPTTYRLRLEAKGVIREWRVGFRSIRTDCHLRFEVNGIPIRPWGANLMHLDTLTNCWQGEKMSRLLDLAMLANCNMLRVWGEAERLPEAFYEECDRRGILLWQDFYLGCSLYPEEEETHRACAREAEQMVMGLRHHPSIALWCGGNELYLARDYQHPEAPCYGEHIVQETLREVCGRLDPGRYYHPSSPSGGRWANDPAGGDTHGYTHLWFVPGRSYPEFLSENCRVSPPVMKSMRRMMNPEELWPEQDHGGVTRSHPYEWPESWNRHTPNEGWRKLGPAEHYRNAENPEEMVYRTAMAHAEYIRIQVGRFRRGSAEPGQGRRTGGHLLWRLNDNSNVISFGVIDYFLNPGHAFYEMKRCYEPRYACCELADSARIWFVNDTPEAFRGRAEISLFHLTENRVTRRKEISFRSEGNTSMILCDLDDWGQFRKENIICTRIWDAAEKMILENLQPAEIERRLPYPEESGLTIETAADGILVKCERYARCVELTAEDDSLFSGWTFEDNFFDLLPGKKRLIRILSGKAGRISARAAYDQKSVQCFYDGSSL